MCAFVKLNKRLLTYYLLTSFYIFSLYFAVWCFVLKLHKFDLFYTADCKSNQWSTSVNLAKSELHEKTFSKTDIR